MKCVYIIKHDVYGYEDDYYECLVEVFNSLESATNYFEIKKEQILQEYYDHTDTHSIQDLIDNHDYAFEYDFEPTVYNLPYAYIWLEEYGQDRLVIQKKDIMEFN